MTDEARVMSRVALPEEAQLERQLRPQRLDEYVGHYNRHPPVPESAAAASAPASSGWKVRRGPVLGGLIN